MNALEGCARAFALRLWGPLLATHPGAERVEEPDLEETWKKIASAPAEILDLREPVMLDRLVEQGRVRLVAVIGPGVGRKIL